jgi:phosphate transport system substrate-binding protein
MVGVYKCTNKGNCDKADKEELIRLPIGSPPICEGCGNGLMPSNNNRKTSPVGISNLPILAGILLLLFVSIGFAVWHYWPAPSGCKPPEILDVATKTCQAPKQPPSCISPEVLNPATHICQAPKQPLPTPGTLLRFHGSNTIGEKLLPALAKGFLAGDGYTNIHTVPGANEEESFIVGEKNGEEKQIEIQAHGSDTAFEGLEQGLCDIGMSSRKIKPDEPDEQAKLANIGLGDLTSNASEHTLALDGIAVIVHPSNPVNSLSITQLAGIFSGEITNWSQVGGQQGPITVYARDKKSGTLSHFKDEVLKPKDKELLKLPDSQRFEDSAKLSTAVANDPTGIGFIGFTHIGSSKELSISDTGVDPRKPNVYTIKTEDYLLSRRLYLYTAEKPTNPYVFKFIKYALDLDSGQIIVKQTGSVDMNPIEELPDSDINPADDPRSKSVRWRDLTSNTTAEMKARIYFRPNSNVLDTRAIKDIERITKKAQDKYLGKKLVLLGFADSKGTHKQNCQLSKMRAEAVRQAFSVVGFKFYQVEGLCDDAPIRSNETPEGREKNRRVEVWVK